jgi:NO-binding membrane sensor protein with MHYT domain
MVGTYDRLLVVISVVVAVVASYVALDMASRVVASGGHRSARYWLLGGTTSMGTGILLAARLSDACDVTARNAAPTPS